jgi:predicted ATPase
MLQRIQAIGNHARRAIYTTYIYGSNYTNCHIRKIKFLQRNNMMKKEKNTTREKEFMDSTKTGRSAAEIFSDIAANIRELAGGDISEEKARQGARRFIQLCQKLIDIEIRIEAEKERKNEQ